MSERYKGAADAHPLARIAGSGAFVAVCRSVYLLEADPNDATGARRIMLPLKNNIGDDKTGFALKIEAKTLMPSGIASSLVVFESGTVQMSAKELLNGAQQTAEEQSALSEAKDFLRDFLKNGPMNTTATEDAAKAAGISPRTLKRARAALGIKSEKSDKTGYWVLRLPETRPTETRGLVPRAACGAVLLGDRLA
jgi:hypothetical protein